MVVAFLHPDLGGHIHIAARLVQQMRLELTIEEVVCGSLVDQQLGQAGALLDQCAGVVLAP